MGDIAQQFLQVLLEIETWNTSCQDEPPVGKFNFDLSKDESKMASIQPPLDGVQDILLDKTRTRSALDALCKHLRPYLG
jgi:hypothetical protein